MTPLFLCAKISSVVVQGYNDNMYRRERNECSIKFR
ncbi:hypothetical protein [Enterococcus phage PEF1]